jgi:type I restriction enzyme S subunit
MTSSNWQYQALSNGIELISGQHVEAKYVNDSGDGLPYLTGPADFPNGEIIVTKFTKHGKKYCQRGDILITVKGSGTGKVIIADSEYVISRQLMAIRPTKYDPGFTYYNLIANFLRFKGAASGLIPGISRDDVLNTPIVVPSIKEQSKIAKILKTWDKAISATEQLINNSKMQKKALMQRLLTGQKRFPEFVDEWCIYSLEQIFEFKRGKGISKKDLTVEGNNKCVLYGELYTKYNEVIKDVVSKTNVSESIQSKVGDVLIPSSTTTSGIDLANATAILEANVLLGGDINILRPKKEIDSIFFAHLLTHIKTHEIASKAQGITIIHLYGKDLKEIKVRIPSLHTEQMKIATVLESADKGINLLNKQLTDLKQEKKSLMKQLLTGTRQVSINGEAA